MYNDSADMFREMDEIFDHLFSRWADDSLFPGLNFTESGITEIPSCTSPEINGCGEIPAREMQDYEPVPEVFRDEDGVTIAVELPGVTEENLNLACRKGNLIIEAVLEDRQYSARAELPAETDPATMRHSLKNGVLEVNFGNFVHQPGNP